MTRSILHVAQPLDAGVPRVAGQLVADQASRGWRVTVASPAEGDLRRAAEAADADWRRWEATRSPGPAVPLETRSLARLIQEAAPDLVHLHSAKAGLAGRLALRGRLPTVFQPHAWSFEAVTGPLRTASVAWEQLGARWADRIVCVSADEQETGASAGVRGSYSVAPNGVDLERYRPASDATRAASRRLLELQDVPLAVVVGRLSRQKGQDALLHAWPEVTSRVPGATLALVGDGPERRRLEAVAPPQVRFAGATTDVAPWLAAATVVVMPSRWEAGGSLVILEAMASARSVVGTDVAGMCNVLGAEAGEVVPIDDVSALARATTERLSDVGRADREGAAGRRRVEAAYDMRVANERMVAVYDEVLAAGAR